MASFLVDEDLPRWLAEALLKAGHKAVDVRDVGLRGKPDEEIHRYASKQGLTLITGDVELGSLSKHPPLPEGTLLVRIPENLSADLRVKQILAAVQGLTREDLAGHIGVIESHGLRLKKVP